MAFNTPTFNLTVNLWSATLVTNPPTMSFLACLSPGRRTMLLAPSTLTNPVYVQVPTWGPTSELMCPKGTDIRGAQNSGMTNVVECPAGSARYYLVLFVEDVGKGFPNEYRLALLKQCDFGTVALTDFQAVFGTVPPWPVPTP
jgi:hypothetical protein